MWYDWCMRKSNNKSSQNKIKRSEKNLKRLKNKIHLSKFERKQLRIRDSLTSAFKL